MNSDIILTIIQIIIGIVIGLIIGYIAFKDVKYIGPNSNEIVKQVYIDDFGKQYVYKPKVCICPSNYSMNKLHDPTFSETHDNIM